MLPGVAQCIYNLFLHNINVFISILKGQVRNAIELCPKMPKFLNFWLSYMTHAKTEGATGTYML